MDNGWLATGLQLVARGVPELSARAGALFDRMDFGFHYRPDVNRILFHFAPDTGEAPCCSDPTVGDSRIASYLGIAKGEIPQRHDFGTWRSFPDSCDWSWQETRPVGFQRTYFGFEGCSGRDPKPDSPPSAYTNGVVTPHATFLALRWAPAATLANLARLDRDFDVYSPWGFRDSVAVDSGVVSDSYLSLDQGIIMAAIGNTRGGDFLRQLFVTAGFQRAVRPLLGVEEFNAFSRGCTSRAPPRMTTWSAAAVTT